MVLLVFPSGCHPNWVHSRCPMQIINLKKETAVSIQRFPHTAPSGCVPADTNHPVQICPSSGAKSSYEVTPTKVTFSTFQPPFSLFRKTNQQPPLTVAFHSKRNCRIPVVSCMHEGSNEFRSQETSKNRCTEKNLRTKRYLS